MKKNCDVCNAALVGGPHCAVCGFSNEIFVRSEGPEVESYRQRVAAARERWQEQERLKARMAELERKTSEQGDLKAMAKRLAELEAALKGQSAAAAASGRGGRSAAAQMGRDWAVPELGLELVWIAPGSFVMGSPESEEGAYSDETQHRVRLTQGYWLGKYAVTQGEYAAVTGQRPSRFSGSDRLPVEQVSWNESVLFCEMLNGKYGQHLPSGYRFGLPTEAQWEYACRAGRSTPFAFGGSLDSSQANFDGNYPYGGAMLGPYRNKTLPVGSFPPNTWGLYDMHGNLWEWCTDWYDSYRGDEIDPTGPQTGSRRVSRGGGWNLSGRYCRSAYRYFNAPDYRYGCLYDAPLVRSVDLGFRLALSSIP